MANSSPAEEWAAVVRIAECSGERRQITVSAGAVLHAYAQIEAATRERDEALARVSDLVENGERLKAVADSVVRDAADIAEAKCALLRDRIEHQVAQAQNERDEARAEVAEIEGALRASGALNQTLLDEVDRLRKANEELYHGTMRQAIRLAATEAKP